MEIRGDGEGRMAFEGREEFLEAQGDVYLGVMNALHRLEGELERLRGVEETRRCASGRRVFASS
jgi:hypothetical protein